MNRDEQEVLTRIDTMVQRIVERFHPQKIILFGSHARGMANSDSDIDLLIVMPVVGSKREQANEIDMALADRQMPLDVIIATPEEFDTYRNVVGHILYPAIREGKVLYECAA